MRSGEILSYEEIRLVLGYWERRVGRLSSRTNLAVFRLSCCLGLRVSEIAGLDVSDVELGSRPGIRIRPEVGKGGKGRFVPLWWDAGTLDFFRDWVRMRREQGGEALICSPLRGRGCKRLSIRAIQLRWKTALRPLGESRRRELGIHAGRHSFGSHALHRGRSLPEVRDALGHSDVRITNIYLHAVPDSGKVGNLFGQEAA